MHLKKNSCPNGCKLPLREKVLQEKEDHVYSFGYETFIYCPNCGSLMPDTRREIEKFFQMYHLHPKLKNAKRLLLKSEFNSAAREAFIVVETVLRDKSGLDSHGFDLATKALKFETDKQTGEITKPPLIAINNLKTESEKNEQEGIRYMLMGFFQGVRNIYQHNEIGAGGSAAITIILNASYFLDVLDGHSITKKARWVLTKVDYRDIYNNMPKKIDRLRFLHMWKKQDKQRKKLKRNSDKQKEE